MAPSMSIVIFVFLVDSYKLISIDGKTHIWRSSHEIHDPKSFEAEEEPVFAQASQTYYLETSDCNFLLLLKSVALTPSFMTFT